MMRDELRRRLVEKCAAHNQHQAGCGGQRGESRRSRRGGRGAQRETRDPGAGLHHGDCRRARGGRRAARSQQRRCVRRADRGFAFAHQIADCLFGDDPRSTGFTERQMASDEKALRLGSSPSTNGVTSGSMREQLGIDRFQVLQPVEQHPAAARDARHDRADRNRSASRRFRRTKTLPRRVTRPPGGTRPAARRSPPGARASSVSRSSSVSGVVDRRRPRRYGGASAAWSTVSLSTVTVSRARSRARFRAVLWRIVNSQARRLVPGSKRSAARNALRYVSCTRSSASAGTRVSRSAVRYRLSTRRQRLGLERRPARRRDPRQATPVLAWPMRMSPCAPVVCKPRRAAHLFRRYGSSARRPATACRLQGSAAGAPSRRSRQRRAENRGGICRDQRLQVRDTSQ